MKRHEPICDQNKTFVVLEISNRISYNGCRVDSIKLFTFVICPLKTSCRVDALNATLFCFKDSFRRPNELILYYSVSDDQL